MIAVEEVKVVYACLKNEHNQVLTVLNHEGHWSLPGGRVETGESLVEALVREVEEETGWNVNPQNILSVTEKKISKRQQHVIFFTFLAHIIGGKERITRPEEIYNIQWVDAENVFERTGWLVGKSGYAPYYNQGIE